MIDVEKDLQSYNPLPGGLFQAGLPPGGLIFDNSCFLATLQYYTITFHLHNRRSLNKFQAPPYYLLLLRMKLALSYDSSPSPDREIGVPSTRWFAAWYSACAVLVASRPPAPAPPSPHHHVS